MEPHWYCDYGRSVHKNLAQAFPTASELLGISAFDLFDWRIDADELDLFGLAGFSSGGLLPFLQSLLDGRRHREGLEEHPHFPGLGDFRNVKKYLKNSFTKVLAYLSNYDWGIVQTEPRL